MNDDGGPAFPTPGYKVTKHDGHDSYERDVDAIEGMTLRDYFAAKALPWSVETESEMVEREFSMPPCPDGDTNPSGFRKWWMEADAKYKYAQADAMLKERVRQ